LAAPPPSDEADALAIAICHGMSARLRARVVVAPARGLVRAP
jgi:Holliday junction resolvasome RuvABC endonuclease subunit